MRRTIGLVVVLFGCGHPSSGDDDVGVDAGSSCVPAAAGAPAERVATTSGVVHGVAAGATFAYLGVPYAAPPTASLRLAAPQPPACATTELDATKLGPLCAQLDDNGAVVGSEDCLQLEVWAPVAAAAPRPVMVWIHGGGNAVGSAVDPLYDGRRLAEAGDVVVVGINYRLGQLGFLAHPALATEGAGSGVYGLLDQIAALQWVHANIAGFGGDAANVTIFGESAGARDVCSLVAAPPAAGLFHRAIMESGSCRALPTAATAESAGAAFATATSCTTDTAACLRALPLAQLLTTLPPTPSVLTSSAYQPAIDGLVQLEQPATAIAAGRHHHVPFVVGANADETGRAAPAVPDAAAYEQLVRAQFGPIANAVLAHYPASAFPTPRAAYVRVTTDARFVCPAREIARAFAAGQSEPVYRYFFTYATNAFGAVHGLDVPFVFGTFDALAYQPTPADLAVSSAVQADWLGFARAGAPTATWPRWDATDPTRVFAATAGVQTGIRTADCDFWQQLAGGQ